MSPSELQRRLLEEVVILENRELAKTGAQALAPDHSPRPAAPDGQQVGAPPRPSVVAGSLQQQVERFLFHQAELLDRKCWRQYIDLFRDDGVYWMPATEAQTEWLDSPSIFAEDKTLMEVRMGRVMHPNAWSQAPQWNTSHLVGNVVIEAVEAETVLVRSRFQMLELRRDALRHFGGVYRHTLTRGGEGFKIALQRVDLLNGQAPFDYVLQIWV